MLKTNKQWKEAKKVHPDIKTMKPYGMHHRVCPICLSNSFANYLKRIASQRVLDILSAIDSPFRGIVYGE